MLVGQLAFSLMSALAHSLKDRCDWQVIAIGRATIPLFLVSAIALASGVRLVVRGNSTLWLRSLAGSVSLICTFYSFTRLPVSDLLTITNLFPVWIALLSWPVLGVRPVLSTWVAIASGIGGVTLIQQPHFAEGNLASLVALTSSVTSAVAMLGLHRLHGMDARAIVVHFSGVSLAFAVATRFFFPSHTANLPAWELTTLLMLLGVGLTASIGQICLTKAFTLGDPAKVSVVGLTQVGFGILLEIALWNRSYSCQTLLGMVLVLAPTAWLMTHVRGSKASATESLGSGNFPAPPE